MEEINKKRIIKSRSYNEPLPKIQKNMISLNKEIKDKNSNSSSSKIMLFNYRKYKIKNAQNQNNPIVSYANDSFHKTIATKNQTDLLNYLKKNLENKNQNSNNNNNVVNINENSTKYRTLYRNRTQESLYTLRPKNKFLNNFQDSKDSQEENCFNLNYYNDLNKSTNRRKTDNMNSFTKNIISNDNNFESKENTENLINIIEQIQKNTSQKDGNAAMKLYNTTRPKKKDKMWTFLLKSKKEKTSANDIIIHYLKENERDNSKNIPFSNFKKYLDKIDYKKFNYGLNKIYGNTDAFLRRIEEIKKNNVIAYKKDFNIENYQNTLLKILKKRVSEKSYFKLQASFKQFNERNYGLLIPKGRFINLAEKLKDFLSKDIYEKMKRAKKNYLLYLGKKEEQLHQSEIEGEKRDKFYKKLNKKLKKFNKKRRRNTSY